MSYRGKAYALHAKVFARQVVAAAIYDDLVAYTGES
jgi:hypothetical protein